MFRRSLFIRDRYACSLVEENFGIAMAARIPMMTTTTSSSMSVKPVRDPERIRPSASKGIVAEPARQKKGAVTSRPPPPHRVSSRALDDAVDLAGGGRVRPAVHRAGLEAGRNRRVGHADGVARRARRVRGAHR